MTDINPKLWFLGNVTRAMHLRPKASSFFNFYLSLPKSGANAEAEREKTFSIIDCNLFRLLASMEIDILSKILSTLRKMTVFITIFSEL